MTTHTSYQVDDRRVDGRMIALRANADLVRITQITVGPFEEEDDIEILVGDFSREALIAALHALNAPTGAIELPTKPRKIGGVGTPKLRRGRWFR